MEYGEAISSNAADKAFDIARRIVAEGSSDLRQAAIIAVAQAYCVCVVDGEDAVEGHISAIHANLIADIEARLRDSLSAQENK